MLLGAALPTQAARNWTGAISGNWSDPNNWSPVGVPTNGDALFFGNVSDAHRSMVNDLAGLKLVGLTFYNNGYQLDGNALELALNLSIANGNDSRTITINCPLTIGSDVEVTDYVEIRIFQSVFGQVTESTAYLHLNGPLTLKRDLHLIAEATDTAGGGNGKIYVPGVISGNGDVYAAAEDWSGHTGSVEFDGTPGNTFSGTLYLSTTGNAQIIFNKSSGVVVSNRVAVVPNSYGYAESANLNLAGPSQIDTNATVLVDGGSQLHLMGNNAGVGFLVLTNFSGDTNASTIDTGSTTLSLNGGIVAWNDSQSVIPVVKGTLNLNDLPNGWLTFNIGGSQYAGLDLQAILAGTGNGGFTKLGSAALLLEANNTFNGPVFVNRGILDLRNNNALGYATTSTFLRGGSLTLRNVTIPESLAVESNNSLLFSIGNCTWSGPITLGANLVVWADNTALTGPISGSGGINFINGTATIGGSAANSYTGTTLSSCALLQLGKPAGVRAFAGPLSVGGTGQGLSCEARWLQSYQCQYAPVALNSTALLNLNNNHEDLGTIDFTSGGIETGSGELGIYGTITVHPLTDLSVNLGSFIAGHVNLPSGIHECAVLVTDPYQELQIDAEVHGPGELQKTGPGILSLQASNSYTGLTLVSQGTLAATIAAALGTADSGTLVQPGATLELDATGTMKELISLNGTGTGGTNGALHVLSTVTLQNQFPSIYACLDLTTDATVRVDASASLTASGFVSGHGPLRKTGPGPMHLAGSGNNTYTGDTVVTEGTLYLDKAASVLSVPQNLVIGPASSSSPATVIFSHGGQIGGSTATVDANATLNLNGNSQTLTQLILNDGGSAQTGVGALQFASGGTVQVGSLSLLGGRASASLSGIIELPANDTLTFNVASYGPAVPFNSPPELVCSASIRGDSDATGFAPAGITKTGFGQMRLSGSSTFAGSANVYAGSLIVTSPTALGTTQGATYAWNSGTLALDGGVTVSGESLYLNGNNVPALDSRTGSNTWTGIINVSGNSYINVNNSMLASGVISGSGSLTKMGPGLLAFGGSANNTYSGDTFVNLGVLSLQKPAGVTAIPHNVSIGNGSGSAILRHQSGFAIIGQVTVNQGGLWDLNGQAEGFSLISPPPVTLNDGGNIQSGTSGIFYLPVGGDLVVNPGTNTSTISGNIGMDAGIHHFNIAAGSSSVPGLVVNATISQTGTAAGIQKDGAGWLRLTGTNTYTGTNIVATGRMQIDGSQSPSPVQITGGTLMGNGTAGTVTYTSGSGFVTPGAGVGILTCGNFSASGGAGTLQMELNGPNPGTGYDQLAVNGTVNLSGIALAVLPGFVPSTNQQFTILSNDGTDAVVGTFNGMPQNAQVRFNDSFFRINYSGGSGNDVVLTHLYTLPPPLLQVAAAAPGLVRVFWSTNYPEYNLQYSLNAAAPTWAAAYPLPAVVGTNYVVTNPVVGTARFYRLSSQPAPNPSRPMLSVQKVSPAAVRVFWPVDDPTFTLQSATNLTSANWTAVSPAPSTTNYISSVTNSIAAGQRYYRLFHP